MLTSSFLIAVIAAGIVVLIVLIAIYLKSRSTSDKDSRNILVNINSSLDDIMERVDSLEAQRKAGVTSETSEPGQAARSDVDDFLSQFDNSEPVIGGGKAVAGFDVPGNEMRGVSNDDFWSDFDRPLKKLDGHDRETQASLKPRSDRPMRLSRQTLVPQGEEQEKMQEEIRRQTMQHMYQSSEVGTFQVHTAMPQRQSAPSPKPAQQQTFVQPVFASAGQSQPAQPRPQPAQPRPQPAQSQPVPVAQPQVQQFVPQQVQPVRPVRQPAARQQVQPVRSQSAQSMMAQWESPSVQPVQQPNVQPVHPRPAARQPAAPVTQRPAAVSQPVPQRPAAQPIPQRTAPQEPRQQSFVQPQFTRAGIERTVQPVRSEREQMPVGNIKYTDRNSGRDKQGRSYSVEELMQQIR